jgi:hypothetical protein
MEPITEVVAPVVEPVAAVVEPVAEVVAVVEPVAAVVEPVAEVVEVVAEVVEPVAEVVEVVAEVVEPVAEVVEPDVIIPTTHDEADRLKLFFTMKHFLSERLLNRAMHALLDVVVPDAWSWASNVDITNVNEGVDPMFDAIQAHMNAQTTFKYDVKWEKNNKFTWIIRQLNYIAKHGVPQYKTLYANYHPTNDTNIAGLWVQHDAGV